MKVSDPFAALGHRGGGCGEVRQSGGAKTTARAYRAVAFWWVNLVCWAAGVLIRRDRQTALPAEGFGAVQAVLALRQRWI